MRFRFRRPKTALTPPQPEALSEATPEDVVASAIPAQQQAPDGGLCGKPTKSGGTCRWNVAAKGPCLPHREAPNLMAAFDQVAAPSAVRGD